MSLNALVPPNVYHLHIGNLEVDKTLQLDNTTAFSSGFTPLAVQNSTGLVGTYTPSGGVLSLGVIGNAPNPDGALITGTMLQLEPANASFGGVVTTTAQEFAGVKTFDNDIVLGANIQITDFASQGIFMPGNNPVLYSAGSDTNVCLGVGAGMDLQFPTVTGTTLIGGAAGFTITTGTNNTIIGSSAGTAYISSESNNTCIGCGTAGINGESGALHISDFTGGRASNTYIGGIGNGPGITALGPTTQTVLVNGNDDQIYATNNLYINGYGSTGTVGIFDPSTGNAIFTGRSDVGSVFLGLNAGMTTSAGISNTVVGGLAYANATGGNNNVIMGFEAGNAYTAAESQNICIGQGVIGIAGETGAIHIGLTTHQSCQIGGISGKTSAGAVPVVINSGGLLGTVVSSQKYKNSITPVSDAESSRILDLECVSFKYNGDKSGEQHYGFIAEDVLDIIPEVIVYEPMRDEDGAIIHDEDDNIIYSKDPSTIKYHLLWPLLQDQVKNLSKMVKHQEKLILQLMGRLDELSL